MRLYQTLANNEFCIRPYFKNKVMFVNKIGIYEIESYQKCCPKTHLTTMFIDCEYKPIDDYESTKCNLCWVSDLCRPYLDSNGYRVYICSECYYIFDYLTILEPLDLFNSGPDRSGWLIDYG